MAAPLEPDGRDLSSASLRALAAAPDKWYQRRLVSLDLETTGVDYVKARIVQAAISTVGADQPGVHQSWIINPGIKIPAEATAIHGIDDARAAAVGVEPKQALSEILDYLEQIQKQGLALVVFNARFDISILHNEALRNQLTPLDERVELLVVDPMVIDRRLDRFRPGRRRLEDLCDHYRVPFQTDDAHNAETDALAGARLAWRMGQIIPELQVDLTELTRRERVWAEKSAWELQRYFREQGRSERVDIDWPFVREQS